VTNHIQAQLIPKFNRVQIGLGWLVLLWIITCMLAASCFAGVTAGYDNEVIFADGTFVDGSTAELSADGPIRPPFVVYCQGGTHWTHWAMALESALESLQKANIVPPAVAIAATAVDSELRDEVPDKLSAELAALVNKAAARVSA